jgi:hypothetical protein
MVERAPVRVNYDSRRSVTSNCREGSSVVATAAAAAAAAIELEKKKYMAVWCVYVMVAFRDGLSMIRMDGMMAIRAPPRF